MKRALPIAPRLRSKDGDRAQIRVTLRQSDEDPEAVDAVLAIVKRWLSTPLDEDDG